MRDRRSSSFLPMAARDYRPAYRSGYVVYALSAHHGWIERKDTRSALGEPGSDAKCPGRAHSRRSCDPSAYGRFTPRSRPWRARVRRSEMGRTPQGSPHFSADISDCWPSSIQRSNEARRCQGCHCVVEAALLEEYDRSERVMADDCQKKNSIE